MTDIEDKRVLVWSYWPKAYIKDIPPEFVADGMTITALKLDYYRDQFRADKMRMFDTMVEYHPELLLALEQFNLAPEYTLAVYWDETGSLSDPLPQWAIGMYFNFADAGQAMVYRLFYKDWESKL